VVEVRRSPQNGFILSHLWQVGQGRSARRGPGVPHPAGRSLARCVTRL